MPHFDTLVRFGLLKPALGAGHHLIEYGFLSNRGPGWGGVSVWAEVPVWGEVLVLFSGRSRLAAQVSASDVHGLALPP